MVADGRVGIDLHVNGNETLRSAAFLPWMCIWLEGTKVNIVTTSVLQIISITSWSFEAFVLPVNVTNQYRNLLQYNVLPYALDGGQYVQGCAGTLWCLVTQQTQEILYVAGVVQSMGVSLSIQHVQKAST